MLAIVDYEMGNLRSVQKAFEKIGTSATIVDKPERIKDADRVILPGVGAFRDAIALLNQSGLGEAVLEHAQTGKPLLGICLGMQLMFEKSLEGGQFQGLGLVPGTVKPFEIDSTLKIPHMGWNSVSLRDTNSPNDVLDFRNSSSDADPFFYFVHSYHCVPSNQESVGLETDYGGVFCSAVAKQNIVATQFHPEKSQQFGLELLTRFSTWSP